MILYLNNFFSESIDLWVNKVQLVDRGAALSRSFKSDRSYTSLNSDFPGKWKIRQPIVYCKSQKM